MEEGQSLEPEDKEDWRQSGIGVGNNLTGEHIDEWSLQYPPVLEVMKESLWVKPMLVEGIQVDGGSEGGCQGKIGNWSIYKYVGPCYDIYVANMY